MTNKQSWGWDDMFPGRQAPAVRHPDESGASRGLCHKKQEKIADRDWLKEQLKTKKQWEIAVAQNCSLSTVSKWKKKHGL